MPIPFLNSINLTKNQVENFCIYNLGSDPTGSLTASGDYGYFWLNTAGQKTLKWWDGANIRSIIDSTNIGSFTSGLATDLAGGAGGDIPYQVGTNDTGFLSLGSAGQVLAVNSGLTGPEWINQSSMSVGSATNKTGGNLGDILVQSGSGTTGFLNVGTAGQVITSNGASPQYVNQSTLSVGSATTAGSVTNSLTAGTYLTSGGTYNGSVARTFAVDATDANTASKVVARDASGNFAAGTITATRVTGLSAPTAGSDAANRDYVDSVAQGLDVKASCKAATVSNINLASPGATIDTVSLSVDNRVLVKDQSAPAENGIYLWKGAAVAMVRSPDADTWDDLVGAFTFVEEGTAANADSGWVCTVNAGGTLGSTAVTWVKFSQAGSYTAGNGIVQSGTSFNFAQSTPYTAGQIPFASSTTAMGFNANLHWDNGNNRLGIGTATPGAKLDVMSGGTSEGVYFKNSDGDRVQFITPNRGTTYSIFGLGNGMPAIATIGSGIAIDLGIGTYGAANLILGTNNTERLRIASDGVCTWSNVGGVAGERMKLDVGGLGIGVAPTNTASSRRLDIGGSLSTYVTFSSTSTNANARNWAVGANVNTYGDFAIIQSNAKDGDPLAAGTTRFAIDSSGNVGIGTATPAVKFHLSGSDSFLALLNGVTKGVRVSFLADESKIEGVDNTGFGSYQPLSIGGSEIRFDLSNSRKALLDASGNLGLGVTPKTWSAYKPVLQVGLSGAIASTLNSVSLASNWYFDGNDKYMDAYAATLYQQYNGGHYWYRSTSTPVAGNNPNFVAAMTLDASGNLSIGTTAGNGKIHVAANGRYALFQPTTSTSSGYIGFSSDSFVSNRSIIGTDNSTGNSLWVSGGAAYALSIGTVDALPIVFATSNSERLRIKSTGQVNFFGLASDPAGAAGDVYYNSGSNVFKVYDTGWKTLPRKYSTALAGTSTTFDVTHNLGTQDVTVMVRKSASTFDVVYTDIQVATTNKVTIVFASSVTGSDYTVTVIG